MTSPAHQSPGPTRASVARVITCQDVLAIIDDGNGRPEDYIDAEKVVIQQAKQWPEGLGVVVVVPAGARRPPEDTRKAIDGVLTRLSAKLKALVWVVEGSGFKAAATRGVIMGLSLYGKRAYPTHVASSLTDGLSWLLPMLPARGKQRGNEGMVEIVQTIARVRSERTQIQYGAS